MTEEIAIRQAGPEDFPAVSRQVAHSYRAAYRGLMDAGYLSSLAGDHWVPILQEAAQAGHTCLIALRGAEVVGSIVFGRSTADPAPGVYEIFALYLLPAYTGQGLGHRLYLEAEGRMLRAGAHTCVAEALSGNTRSISFCLGHGFRKAGAFLVQEHGMELSCETLRKEWRGGP